VVPGRGQAEALRQRVRDLEAAADEARRREAAAAAREEEAHRRAEEERGAAARDVAGLRAELDRCAAGGPRGGAPPFGQITCPEGGGQRRRVGGASAARRRRVGGSSVALVACS
jgi:septal ring factor EnvC (AmiA/AmiB activator)